MIGARNLSFQTNEKGIPLIGKEDFPLIAEGSLYSFKFSSQAWEEQSTKKALIENRRMLLPFLSLKENHTVLLLQKLKMPLIPYRPNYQINNDLFYLLFEFPLLVKVSSYQHGIDYLCWIQILFDGKLYWANLGK